MEEFLENEKIMSNIELGLRPLVAHDATRLQLAKSLLWAFLNAATEGLYEDDLAILLDKNMGYDEGWAILLHDKLAFSLVEKADMPLLIVPDQAILDFGSWFVLRFAKATELGFCLEETLAS